MVKRIYILMVIMLLAACDTRLRDLTMKKTPYPGNELRIDGYYYSNLREGNYIGIAVFYRDGFCIHTWENPGKQDTLSYIQNKFLLNSTLIDKIKSAPTNIGVFQIIYPDIQFEIWEYRTDPTCYFGKVINDTTFIINRRVNNRTKETYSEKLTYRFKQFSPKPDSTNVWIK